MGATERDEGEGPGAAREVAVRLELALEVGGLGAWAWDIPSGRVTWSPALEAIHGLPPGGFQGTFEAFQADIHPDDRERVLQTISASLESGSHSLAYRIIDAAGETRWLEARGKLLRDGQGKPQRLLGVCSDVTERTRADHDLRLSEERFAITLRSIGDAVIATDAQAQVTFMNPVAEALCGFTIDEARGRPLDDVFRIADETTRQSSESPVARALREGTIVGLANHTILFRRDGSEICIDDSAAPIRDPDGSIMGVVLVFRDVTAKRREDLRREFIHEATRLLTSSLDYEMTLSRAAQLSVPRISDWCAIDMLEGNHLRRLAVAHVDPDKVALAHALHDRYPPDRHAEAGAWHVLRTGETDMMGEIPPELIEAAAQDDDHRDIIRRLGLSSYMVVPMRGSEAILGVISFVGEGKRRFDDGDRNLAEQVAACAAIAIENARHHHEMQSALKMREELLAIVSHDLRNPLGVVMMSANVLRAAVAADEKETASRSVDRIDRAGKQMERLIGDLLNFAAIDAGKLSVSIELHDVRALVEEAVDAVAAVANASSITIQARIDEGMGPVPCDRQRVQQVFANLVGNALKFTPAGGQITVGATCQGGELVCSICDTGAGIPAEQLPRLFEPYWRGKQRADGAGLGLYIARGIVAAHGGRIWAESTVNGGSTFFFSLPLEPQRPTPVS